MFLVYKDSQNYVGILVEVICRQYMVFILQFYFPGNDYSDMLKVNCHMKQFQIERGGLV